MGQALPEAGREQVLPVARAEFLELHDQRCAAGLATYGRPLETHNGRDPIQDAREESVDLWNYLTQIGMERADMQIALAKVIQERDTYRDGLRALWHNQTVWMVADLSRQNALGALPEQGQRLAAIAGAADLLMAWVAEQTT